MKSRLSLSGHPLHVILVDLPITLWIASLAADVVALATGDPFWSRAAWWAIAAGIVTALMAAAAGAVDYFNSVPPHSTAQKTARTHGLLNVGIVVLFSIGLWLRSDGPAVGGSEWWTVFALSAVGVLALAYSGWLGGTLVYGYEMGVERIQAGGRPTIYGGSESGDAGVAVAVAGEDELEPGQVKHVVVNGAWILLVRTAEGWRAVDGICTHHGGALCDGMLFDETIQCPWHGSRFDVRTGEVLGGPAKRPLHVWPVTVREGRVWVAAPADADAVAKAQGGH